MHKTYEGSQFRIQGNRCADNAGFNTCPTNTYNHIIGLRIENGRMVGGRVVYCSDWAPEALSEIAHLTRALKAIADGEGDAQEIARQALKADCSSAPAPARTAAPQPERPAPR